MYFSPQTNVLIMNIQFQSSILITNNFDRLKSFYVDVLGLTIELDFGPCITFNCGLAIWKLSEKHTVARYLGRQYSTDGNKNLELCFEAEDFDKSVKKLREYNPKLLHDIEEETWGQRTIRFFDPDNNLIELGEPLPGFVKRLHDEGMSIDQVAEKTSVPVDQVKELVAS